MAEIAILNSLVDLHQEVSKKDNFFENDLSQDIFVYKNRALIILGLVSYLGIRLILKHDDDINLNIDEIEFLLQRLEPQINLWGESGVPFLLNTYWFYAILKKNEKAQRILASTILSILNVSKKNIAFPNFYYSAEEALLMAYDSESKEKGNVLSSRNSFVLETLIHLATKDKLKEFLQLSWKEISKCFFEEFKCDNSIDLYKWRVREGTELTRTPESLKKWNDLKKEALIFDNNLVPKVLKERPYLIPLFIVVYPHRTNRDITLFFEEKISQLV